MIPKTFLDTNIIVYSVDRHEPRKRDKARSLLARLESDHAGVVSTQVLQEFYVTAVKKLGVPPLDAKAMMEALTCFELVVVGLDQIRHAADCSILNRISFWDGLIIASAEAARCTRVWSEDLSSGQTLRGVTVINPFLS